MKEKVTRINIAEHLVKYQLSLIGRTIEDAQKDKQWLYKWTIPREEAIKFEKYAIALLKKTFKYNTKKARGTYGWWFLQWGLNCEI